MVTVSQHHFTRMKSIFVCPQGVEVPLENKNFEANESATTHSLRHSTISDQIGAIEGFQTLDCEGTVVGKKVQVHITQTAPGEYSYSVYGDVSYIFERFSGPALELVYSSGGFATRAQRLDGSFLTGYCSSPKDGDVILSCPIKSKNYSQYRNVPTVKVDDDMNSATKFVGLSVASVATETVAPELEIRIDALIPAGYKGAVSFRLPKSSCQISSTIEH